MPSSGSRRPSPANVLRFDVTPARFWSAAMTANAPRFMNTYTARYSRIACAAAGKPSRETPPKPVVENEWVHVAVVFDPAAGEPHLSRTLGADHANQVARVDR